jgi:membrane-associated phospholipid phosphatase
LSEIGKTRAMSRRRAKYKYCFCLLAAGMAVCATLYAGPQTQQSSKSSARVTEMNGKNLVTSLLAKEKHEEYEPTIEGANSLGVPLLKNLVSDQKAIWTSPFHLRWADGSWLFPLAAATGGFFATDRAIPPALSTDPKKVNRYTSFSNYGVYSLVGVGGGLYVWSRISHDDHQRETGILAGEAAIDSFAVDTTFKYAFGRERPNQGQGLGDFFDRGVSFPSDHSAVAWSIASVLAHEYPGPLTQVAVYGMATAVSASRVLGKQHFPSDVMVGAAIGWLIGRQVYRAHHDPELGGSGWDPLSGNDEREEQRQPRNMGSPFVPLDSWAYAAFERLAALGYVHTAILGMKPWTRLECARLTEEAAEELPQQEALNEEASRLEIQLSQEFAYEMNLLNGGRNFTANLESVYARAVSISGPPLTDGYHFGQTVAYDFGRPFERGTNGQAGGSFSAAAGPVALYVRTEYQHAPSAPAPSTAIRNLIAQVDLVSPSQVPVNGVAALNQPQLLEAYATVNLSNWQLVLGRQSISWAAGPDSMTWSDNARPVNMVRLVNPEPFRLPGFLEHLGPVRIEQFFGRLEGHPYVARPFVYGQKISVKIFPCLELGFARRSMIGGTGGDPLTAGNLGRSLLGLTSVALNSVPGDNDSEMDWVFYVPKVRNYIVLYGDAYAEDNILPIENPPRNPWHPGIYITRIPGIPKLDFHMQGVSTESSCALIGANNHGCGGNRGIYNYWNDSYHDGNTNGGNLIGNTVGREGRSIQFWFRYWLSARNTVQFTYKHNSVNADFIPQGGAWQDYGLSDDMYFENGVFVKSELQYENISRYPALFSGPQKNFTAVLEVGFSPVRKKRNGP